MVILQIRNLSSLSIYSHYHSAQNRMLFYMKNPPRECCCCQLVFLYHPRCGSASRALVTGRSSWHGWIEVLHLFVWKLYSFCLGLARRSGHKPKTKQCALPTPDASGMDYLRPSDMEKDQNKKWVEAGDVAQWLRAPTALAEDLGSVPQTYMSVTSLTGCPTPSSGLQRHCPHLVHLYTCWWYTHT